MGALPLRFIAFAPLPVIAHMNWVSGVTMLRIAPGRNGAFLAIVHLRHIQMTDLFGLYDRGVFLFAIFPAKLSRLCESRKTFLSRELCR